MLNYTQHMHMEVEFAAGKQYIYRQVRLQKLGLENLFTKHRLFIWIIEKEDPSKVVWGYRPVFEGGIFLMNIVRTGKRGLNYRIFRPNGSNPFILLKRVSYRNREDT